MKFSTFLIIQFTHFVETYRKYFWRTLGAVLIYSTLCFLTVAVLLVLSNIDSMYNPKQLNWMSFFFTRFSENGIYYVIDLSKNFFLFYVSLYSSVLMRIIANKENDKIEFRLLEFVKKINMKNFLYLFIALTACCVLDYCLFETEWFFEKTVTNAQIYKWLFSIIFLLQIYLPMIIFSITLYQMNAQKWINLSFKKVFCLFISLWFFNEFAWKIYLLARSHIFRIILIIFGNDSNNVIEILLGIFLLALFFTGYYSAMTALERFDEQEDTDTGILNTTN